MSFLFVLLLVRQHNVEGVHESTTAHLQVCVLKLLADLKALHVSKQEADLYCVCGLLVYPTFTH